MSKCNTGMVIGMDMSDKNSEICVIDQDCKVLERKKVANTFDGLEYYFSAFKEPS